MEKPTKKIIIHSDFFVTIVQGFINILLYNTVVLWLYTIYFTKVLFLFVRLFQLPSVFLFGN